LSKARIMSYEDTKPFFKVKLEKVENEEVSETQAVLEALMRSVRENLEKVISLGKILSPDILMVLEDIQDPGRLADLVASNLNLKVSEAQHILELLNPYERLHRINDILVRELEILAVQAQIKSSAKEELSKTQKEYFLREQIKAIKTELGDEGEKDEFTELKEKILAKGMSEEAEKEAIKQLQRLERMHPDSSESSIMRTYLEWMTDIPWSEKSEEITDLNYAKD